MKTIKLNTGAQVIVDDEDYKALSLYKWHLTANRYAHRTTTDKDRKRIHYSMHRLLAGAEKGQHVDHINGNPLDNRKANLRLCTIAENQRNLSIRKDNKTGYKGVHLTKRSASFEATIQHKGKNLYIGRYKTAIEAAKAYDKKAMELFGDFAKLNFGGIYE